MKDAVVRELAAVLDTTDMREERARLAVEVVRKARDYRWVGIYDVDDNEIEIVGHTGVQAPAFVRFAATEGLCGDVIRTRSMVVRNQPLPSEAVVPILGAESGIVVGVLDVESDRGFDDVDRDFLEACTPALMPLFE
ncbi:MAG TPA: GAF domain-containing protein [Candidatus Baltobacteraceae bacterium]|nr:GAF domain-containing protein [Candidatus Baltobacteraceae bacterium]